MDTNCRKRLHRWIKRFSLSDDIYTDCHITDFCNEIQRREWLKVSFSILDICTEFIKVEEYNEFIYIGFSLKDKREKVIPETLKLSMIDKWTPPFIILSKKRIEISEDYFAAKNLSEVLHKKVFIWQYKEGSFFFYKCLYNSLLRIQEAPISWNDSSNSDDPQAGYGYIPNDTTKEETFFYHSDHLGSTSYITDDKANKSNCRG